ncbi:hypothetical protein [Nocardia terpenica]|nr:hypothetical protein [Nocardia terpenica]
MGRHRRNESPLDWVMVAAVGIVVAALGVLVWCARDRRDGQ